MSFKYLATLEVELEFKATNDEEAELILDKITHNFTDTTENKRFIQSDIVSSEITSRAIMNPTGGQNDKL